MPPSIKAVGTKELKNHLSAYLKEVRAGTAILVLDRNHVVAELRQPSLVESHSVSPVLLNWLSKEVITLPQAEKTPCPDSPLSAPEGTSAALLDAVRGE